MIQREKNLRKNIFRIRGFPKIEKFRKFEIFHNRLKSAKKYFG